MSVNKRFRKRCNGIKITWAVLLTACVIITVVLVYFALNDKEKMLDVQNQKYVYGIKPQYRYPLYVFGNGVWLCAVLFVLALVTVRFRIYCYKEHEIGVYLGFGCAYLTLDDVVVAQNTGRFYAVSPLEYDIDGVKVLLTLQYVSLYKYSLCVGKYSLIVGDEVLR